MTCRDFPPFISYSIMYFCSQTLTSLKDIKNDHKEAYLVNTSFNILTLYMWLKTVFKRGETLNSCNTKPKTAYSH